MQHHSLSLALQSKLGPEDREAYAFANALRVETLEGRLRAIWTHPANELAGMTTGTGKYRRVPVAVAIARALGLIAGASDYLFLWERGSLAMEFKSAKGRLNDAQTDFRRWCEMVGVPFHIVRSVDQGLDLLETAGVLIPERRVATA